MSWTFAWRAIRRYKILVGVFLLAGLTGGLLVGIVTPANYETNAQLTVEMSGKSSGSDSGRDPAVENDYLKSQMPTYLEYAQSRRVLEPVAQELGSGVTLDTVRQHLDVSVPSDTLVVEITATWNSPDGAAELANAAAASFARRAPGFAADTVGANRVQANIFAPATTPVAPVERRALPVGLGALAGGLIGVILSWVLALRDPYVRSVTDIEDAGGAPVLGLLPQNPRTRSRTAMTGLLAAGRVSGLPDSFEGLYARAGLADSTRRPRIVTVVRATPGAASEHVVWGLGQVAASSGLRTVIATADAASHRYVSSRLAKVAARSGTPDLLPLEALAAPACGISSTAALNVALGDVVPAVDLVLICARSPLEDPNTFSQMGIAEGVLVATPPKTEYRVVNAVADRIRQSSDRLVGYVVTDHIGTAAAQYSTASARQSMLTKVANP